MNKLPILFNKLIILVLVLNNVFAQNIPTIEWEKVYGGNYLDRTYGLINNLDDGFLTYGYRQLSITGTPNETNPYSWIVNTNDNGDLIWEKNIRFDSSEEVVCSISKTSDLNYLVLECIYLDNTRYNVRLLKINSIGEILWFKTFTGLYQTDDVFKKVIQTSDGGIIIVGYSNSSDGLIFNTNFSTSSFTQYDAWIMKLNSNGDIIWKKNYGSPNRDFFNYVHELSNSDLIVSGFTGDSASLGGFWVLRMDSLGQIIWDKKFGGVSPLLSIDNMICKTELSTENELIAIGKTSFITSGSQNKSVNTIFKLDLDGNIIWEQSYNDPSIDLISDIKPTKDNGFVVLGSHKKNIDNTDFNKSDIWLMRIDSLGNKLWENYYDNGYPQYGNEILISNDNEFVISSNVTSNYFTANNGAFSDLWLFKLTPDISIDLNYGEDIIIEQPNDSDYVGNDCDFISIYPNPLCDFILNTNFKTTENKVLRIFDIRGRFIKEYNGFLDSIKIDEIRDGVYLFQILIDENIICQKKLIIKN